MSTNITKLKSAKGAPPPAFEAPDIIADNTRPEEKVLKKPTEEMKPLQFRVPPSVFEEFSEFAGRQFGFNKGAKSNLFLKMWAEYKIKTSS